MDTTEKKLGEETEIDWKRNSQRGHKNGKDLTGGKAVTLAGARELENGEENKE